MINFDNNNNIYQYEKLMGYNPFINSHKNNAKLGKSLIRSYRFYFDMLSMLAQARFKWENIPIEVPNYQIEKCLFYAGMAGITYDDIAKQYVILPVVYTSNGLNMYGEPKTFTLFSYTNATQYPNIINDKNGIICYNNSIKDGNLFLCYRYAQRLQMIDDIIDMNIDKQRTPYIILCPDEKEKNSLKKFLTELTMNTGAVFATKDITKDNITALDLRVELKAIDLQQVKREIFGEACLYLGINSSLNNKKERLIANEVENEEQRYQMYREIALQPRQYFCQKVKKFYNLDFKVKYSTDIKDEIIEDTIIDTDTKDEKRKEKTKKLKKEINNNE